MSVMFVELTGATGKKVLVNVAGIVRITGGEYYDNGLTRILPVDGVEFVVKETYEEIRALLPLNGAQVAGIIGESKDELRRDQQRRVSRDPDGATAESGV